MNPTVKAVQYESPYKLILTFTNNEVRAFDLSHYLHYPVYESLRNESFCAKAEVYSGTIIWDDITDFDPDTLFLESKVLFDS